YDYIEIDHQLLNEIKGTFVENELSRLSNISHLGLIGRTRILAKHTKLEHAYGTYWVSYQCGKNSTGLIGNKKAFNLAGLLHGIGHLPFSYDTEYALTKLYYIHRPTKDRIDAVLDTCLHFLNNNTFEIIAEKMRAQLDYNSLFRWFTVYKLAKSQSFNNDLGRQIAGVILDPTLLEHQLFMELDKLDCVLRDMHYLALGKIELGLVPLMKQFGKDAAGKLVRPAFFKVIDSTYDCLKEQVYFGPEEKCLASVWEKALVIEAIENGVQIDNLMGATDTDLEGKLEKRIVTGEIVRKVKEGKILKVGNYSCDFKGKPLAFVEARLSGTNLKGIHNSHQRTGIYVQCFPEVTPEQKDVVFEWATSRGSSWLVVDSSIAKPNKVIGALLEIEQWFPEARFGTEASCRLDAMRYILGLDVRPDFFRYRSDVESILKKVIPYKNIQEISSDKFYKTWHLKDWAVIEGLIYHENEDWILMHFLEYPEHWSTTIVEKILNLVRLPRLRPRKGESKGDYQSRKERMLEYQNYLEKLLKLRHARLNGWVLPSIRLTDGKNSYEIDAISLYIEKGKACLDFSEVSYNCAPEKEQEVRTKLLKVSQQVSHRFNKKINIKSYFNDKSLF
ncbi:hypothetical protein MUP77_22295, partial [Candidatus Bathyarchaeota archaeon]|nr:hypothetical protein [Candidatus Bathyarchaeota archaeon]